jgi:hypothetical protein
MPVMAVPWSRRQLRYCDRLGKTATEQVHSAAVGVKHVGMTKRCDRTRADGIRVDLVHFFLAAAIFVAVEASRRGVRFVCT